MTVLFSGIRQSNGFPAPLLGFFLLVVLTAALAGCGRHTSPPPVKPPVENGGEEAAVEEGGGEETKEANVVALYFADEQAACLVEEERDVPDGEDPRIFALEALIAGPLKSGLGRTIPADVRVLGIRVAGGIAEVDFSAELHSSHWGGSTGELLTVYSIVNTLCRFPEIERVQIVIDGEKVETLSGHMELDKPLDPDFGFVTAGTELLE